MNPQADLDNLLRQARAALAADPTHHLALGLRQAIWSALGPRGAGPGAGLRRRALLATASAERALPIWRARFGDDELPRETLQLAQRALARDFSEAEADRMSEEIWHMLTELADGESGYSVAAGFAAAQALNTAIHDELFDPEHIDLAGPENEDPDVMDAACYAAIALSGGYPWEEASDPVARLAFWSWWLDEAGHRERR
jgi:hypothetical protein